MCQRRAPVALAGAVSWGVDETVMAAVRRASTLVDESLCRHGRENPFRRQDQHAVCITSMTYKNWCGLKMLAWLSQINAPITGEIF